MVFEEIFRSSPRRRASSRVAEGFSPTARGAYRIYFSISISSTARGVYRIIFSISIISVYMPPEASASCDTTNSIPTRPQPGSDHPGMPETAQCQPDRCALTPVLFDTPALTAQHPDASGRRCGKDAENDAVHPGNHTTDRSATGDAPHRYRASSVVTARHATRSGRQSDCQRHWRHAERCSRRRNTDYLDC
jgi:hypothetical protein